MVEVDDQIFSSVQIRGSIPLFWQQVVGLEYKPKLVVETNPLTVFIANKSQMFKTHFDDLFNRYGDVIAVNLINKSGYEKPLGDEFQTQVMTLNDERLKYIHFDFHKECSKMQWHRLSLLMNQIQNNLDTQGYLKIT